MRRRTTGRGITPPRGAGLRLAGLAIFVLFVACSVAEGQGYTLRFGPSAGAVGGEANISVLLDIGAGQVPVNAWSMGVCHGASVEIISVSDGSTTASIGPDFQQKQLLPGQGWTVGVVLSFVGVDTIPPGSGYALHVARYALLEEGAAPIASCNTLGSPQLVETLITVADASSTTFPPVQLPGSIEVGLIPPFTCTFAPASGTAGGSVAFALDVENPVPFDGFALGVRQPDGLLAITAIEPGAALLAASGGTGPAYFLPNLAPVGGAGSGATVACLLALIPPFVQVPGGAANEIITISGTIDADASAGSELVVELTDELGSPPILSRFTVGGTSVEPISEPGVIEVSGSRGGETEFVRGDITGDGALSLGDPVSLVVYLFGAGSAPACPDAGDLNDDGSLLLDDVVLLLGYQFSGGAPPPPPFPECGVDPTPSDPLDCLESFCAP